MRVATQTLAITDRGPVRELTFARPELLNRFDDELHDALTAALEELRDADSVRAAVIASTGKVFSAGGDFALMRRNREDAAYRRATIERARRLMWALLEVRQPVVVAVQGAAMGLGATVALAGDAVVASRNARLADTHVNVGLVAGDGGCLLWPAVAGALRARRHLLTGDPLGAETAFRLGLVTDLVDEPDEVLPAARALADRIADLPPLAVQGTKRTLNRLIQQRFGEIFELGAALEGETLASDDLLEAIAAFEERRPGRYEGR